MKIYDKEYAEIQKSRASKGVILANELLQRLSKTGLVLDTESFLFIVDNPLQTLDKLDKQIEKLVFENPLLEKDYIKQQIFNTYYPSVLKINLLYTEYMVVENNVLRYVIDINKQIESDNTIILDKRQIQLLRLIKERNEIHKKLAALGYLYEYYDNPTDLFLYNTYVIQGGYGLNV